MAWRVARSLEVLRAQLNTIAPGRDRSSDGGIGDAAHASRDSDHNPWFHLPGDPTGIVTARDFTHDPAGGLDGQRLADTLEQGRDRRIKYVIWNRRIMAGDAGPSPWEWRTYRGANPHTKHLHLSVLADATCDDTTEWALVGLARPSAAEWAEFANTPFEWVTDDESEPFLFIEEFPDQEDVGKFLAGLGAGAATGAATGAAAGPWGALIGAGIGAGLSAISQATAPQPPARPPAPPRPRPPAPAPAPAPTPAPAPAVVSPPAPGGRPAPLPRPIAPVPTVRPGVVPPQAPAQDGTALQLALLLPALAQLVQSMAAQPGAAPPAPAVDRSDPATDDAAWEDFAEYETSYYGPTGEYGEFDERRAGPPPELGDEPIEGC
ncbi:hypothetical protein [Amycolatopsis solani]|uniref:hypothetical protein n=2 Tax=Amycolatopsis solani TaxID=3028615 RepID=UPI00296F1DC6|nr:hypothetical protein [Amycolatopsis sp. MEP2-6]